MCCCSVPECLVPPNGAQCPSVCRVRVSRVQLTCVIGSCGHATGVFLRCTS